MANEQYELYQQGTAEALAEWQLDHLAFNDGYYQQLTAGAADNLTGRGDATGGEYLFRTTAGTASVSDDGVATVKSIHGRTLRWNQLCNNNGTTYSANQLTATKNNDGYWTLNGTPDAQCNVTIIDTRSYPEGHKILVKGCPSGGGSDTYFLYFLGSMIDSGNGGIRTVPSDAYATGKLSFIAKVGTSFNNVKFYPQLFDLTQMFGAGSEPSTIEEFTALYPLPYYEYDAGSLLPVNMTGIETVGFNQWDGTFDSSDLHYLAEDGSIVSNSSWRITDYIDCVGGQQYYVKGYTGSAPAVCWYDADKQYIAGVRYGDPGLASSGGVFTVPYNARYLKASVNISVSEFCINLSWSGYRNGEYEPYWSAQRLIDAGTLRGAGTVYDELTETERIVRVGEVDLGSLTWSNPATNIFNAVVSDMATSVAYKVTSAAHDYATNNFNWSSVGSYADKSISTAGNNYIYVKDTSYSDAAAFKAAMSGVMLHYAIAEPTVTPYDPPLNTDYRYADFGTERIMVPDGVMSAPPTVEAVYGINATDTIRNLPTDYTSKKSLQNLIAALDAHNGTTTTMSWSEGQQAYTFAIADNE